MDKENTSTAKDDVIDKILNDKYTSLGLSSDMFNKSTAIGMWERETYKRLYGRYPEER